jgi:hypothetical protein
MNTKHVVGAVAAAAFAIMSHSAMAQPAGTQSGAPTTSGALAPAGQGPGAQIKPSTSSDKSRMERKDTTKADRAAGAIPPAGEGPGAAIKPSTTSQTSRTERKADTSAAVKSGGTQPAGEVPRPVAESQKPRPLPDTQAPKK